MYKIIFFLLAFASTCSVCYASGEWVPYNQNHVIIQEQIITTTIEPKIRVPQLVIKYQLVPHIVLETTQVEKRYLFRTTTEVKTVPVTKWVYQPYYIIE